MTNLDTQTAFHPIETDVAAIWQTDDQSGETCLVVLTLAQLRTIVSSLED